MTIRLFCGGYHDEIHCLEFDPSNNSLIKLYSISAGTPTWLTLVQGKLYSLNEWGDRGGTGEGEITSYDVKDGSLLERKRLGTKGTWPCHAASLKDENLLVTNYKGGSLINFKLTDSLEEVEVLAHDLEGGEGLGPAGRQDSVHLHGVAVDPFNRFVVVPDLGYDMLRVFKVSKGNRLIRLPPIKLTAGGGPRHVSFGKPKSETEVTLYVVQELSNTITSFTYQLPTTTSNDDLSSPILTLLQSDISILPPNPFPHQSNFGSWHAAEIVCTNTHLYVSNRMAGDIPNGVTIEGSHLSDVISIFKIDEQGMSVESLRCVDAAGRTPRHFSIKSIRKGEEEADYLALAAQDSSSIVIHEILAGGELREVARLASMGRPGVIIWE
jgi:6-phosphogluconolactonase (cycloisomerase 2 family)